MKFIGGLISFLIAIAIVVMVGLWLIPKHQSALSNSSSTNVPDKFLPTSQSGSRDSSGSTSPDSKITIPGSDSQRLRDEIGKKRIPFFHMLSEKFARTIVRASVLDDIDTIDLVIPKPDNETVLGIVQNAILPTARDYGFTRVRFYVRNEVGAIDPYRVIAETTFDGTSHWNTFWK